MKDVTLQREANRFVAIRAMKNGVAAVAQQYAIVASTIRPDAIPDSAWTAVVTQGPDVGFRQLPSLVPGVYSIYAKWVDGSDTPVEKAGNLTVI
jgi:hypothetical protein